MGFFATRTRRSTAGLEVWAELSEEMRAALPPRFEAVGEAQASGTGSDRRSIAACREAGHQLAGAGVPLGESLERLMSTSRLVAGRAATYAEISSLAVAWSEATLGYLHRLSCEDPLTGLATQAHVRSRIADLYRDPSTPGEVRTSHALVLLDVTGQVSADAFDQALLLSRLGQKARTVFAGTDTIGVVGRARLVVVTGRDQLLPHRVALLRQMIERTPSRVWIEGLPGSESAAAGLLEELARL